MGSRTIRVDEEVFELIRSNKRVGESDNDTLSRMLVEAAAKQVADDLGTMAQPFEA